MLPVIALVGRPNVGKSTLFNRLTGTRDALVADYPGLTRDRLYGFADTRDGRWIVIDTGGLTDVPRDLESRMREQVDLAVHEADVVVVVVDGRAALTAADEFVAERVRRAGRNVIVAVNKSEGQALDEAAAEFYALGLGEPVAISAARGDRIDTLVARVGERVEPAAGDRAPVMPVGAEGIRIAVIGRPNVGKSTLVNRYLGEKRLLTQDEAGTTRDSIAVPCEYHGRRFVLVDTAGIRRKSRVTETIEKFSIAKALQAVDAADALIVMFDARAGITEQDVSLLGLVIERGRALTLAVNKWDGLSAEQRRSVRNDIDRRLPFLDFVDLHFISALHGSNIVAALDSAFHAAEAAVRELPTPRLNRVLHDAVQAHPPPIVRRHRIKLSFAHQGGKRPPTIVVHGNQTARLPGSYRRYLTRCFRKALKLHGTPVRLELRTSRNPYQRAG